MNQPMTPQFTPYDPAPPRKPAYLFSRGDVALALILWVVGYLCIASVPVGEHPLLALFSQVLLLVGTAVYLSRRSGGHTATPWGYVLVGVGVALALSFLWSVNRAVLAAVSIWNAFSWFYLVRILNGLSRERRPGEYFVGEFLSSVSLSFRAPATAFAAIFGPRRAPDGTPLPKSRLRGAVGWCLLGLAMAFIPTAIVALLLSYDVGFSQIMRDILDAIFSADTLFRQINNIGFGLLLSALLFGAILAGRTLAQKKAEAEAEAISADEASPEPNAPAGDGIHVAPVALVAAMLTPVMVIYIIFFVSQWDYYVSAFTGVRPEALTFSDYAREGFFQLVAVSVINALMGLGAALFAKRRFLDPDRPRRERTRPLIRVYLAVLSLMTLVLIATALSKMFLYVDAYGMSHKRMYATWLMLLLAVAFVVVILRQIISRINLPGTLVAVFLAFFLLLALAPVDTLIVRYNVNAALDGNLATMQGDVCSDSGASGVLPALDFMASTNADPLTDTDSTWKLKEVRAEVDAYLQEMADQLDAMPWYSHNITTLRAKDALTRTGYVSMGTDTP